MTSNTATVVVVFVFTPLRISTREVFVSYIGMINILASKLERRCQYVKLKPLIPSYIRIISRTKVKSFCPKMEYFRFSRRKHLLKYILQKYIFLTLSFTNT